MSAILAMHDVTPYILIAHTAEKRRKENEMRLIDADALLKKTINSPLHAPYITEKDIREMPTIQPVATDTNVGDTISRQQAIDAICCDITVTGKQNAELVASTIGAFVDRIKALPSAQSERMCYGCRYERHGSVVCDSCSRFFLDRYEVDNNE